MGEGGIGQLLERLLRSDDPMSDVPHTDECRPGLHDTLTGEVPTDTTSAGEVSAGGGSVDLASGDVAETSPEAPEHPGE